MASTYPIKCASAEYKAAPFYLIQKNKSEKRYVISFQDIEKIRTFLFAFIDRTFGEIEVKLRDYDNSDEPIDYDGIVPAENLKFAISAYPEVVFHDGGNEFMIRHSETGDYVAFDLHGLVFVYSNDDYSKQLKQLEIPYKKRERLIYEFNHWHVRPAKVRENLHELIQELGLN